MKLYAATTASKVPVVLRKGLTREFPATNDSAFASGLASWKGEERREDGVVLEVEVDERDLRPDWEMYQRPLFSIVQGWGMDDEEEWLEAVREGRIPSPRGPDDWETSLEVVRWVTHIGIVHPDDIRVAWRV